MKSISTSGLLKLIESKKIKANREVSLFFNPNIDYILLLQGLYDMYKRYDSTFGPYLSLKEVMETIFSYICFHYPELAKQYINSIRSEHELMAMLSEDNIEDYLDYYTEKVNNNLEKASEIKDNLSVIDQVQTEIVGELLVERWYPLLKKFFTEHKNVVYLAKYSLYHWSDSIITHLVNSNNNERILLENIFPVEFKLYKDHYRTAVSSSKNLENFSETIPLNRVKGKSVTDFEALSNKLKALEEIDLIVLQGDKLEEKTIEELYPVFSFFINLKIQDTIDLDKIPFDSFNDRLILNQISYLKLEIHMRYKDGYYQTFSGSEVEEEDMSYVLSVGAKQSTNKDDGISVHKHTLLKLLDKYEKYLIPQIENTLKNKGCNLKIKAPKLIWSDMDNPLIEQILKKYNDKKEGNQ